MEDIDFSKTVDIKDDDEEDKKYFSDNEEEDEEDIYSSPEMLKTPPDSELTLFEMIIQKVLWASGDKKEQERPVIVLYKEYIERIIGLIYSPDALRMVLGKRLNRGSKKVMFNLLMHYLKELFPLETCVFYTSTEIKVILWVKNRNIWL